MDRQLSTILLNQLRSQVYIFMIKFIRINPIHKINRLKIKNLYKFSKQPPQPLENQNQNYIKSRQPKIKIVEIQEQNTIPDTVTNDKSVMWGLLIANFCFSSAIYFHPLANIGLSTLNNGFIMSQIGQEFKKFLIIVNNNHMEQLSNYRSVEGYSKIILQNTLILSAQSLFLATNEYYLAHLLTILWYLVSIHKKIVPSSYHPVILTILLAMTIHFIKNNKNRSQQAKQNVSQRISS